MKADLDRLMTERALDALLIFPGENEDPYRTYLSNSVQHSGLVIKRRGDAPVIIVNGMERDEAARSGLPVHTYDDFGYSELRRAYKDCLLYTSDAADDLLCVDLGCRRVIKKKKIQIHATT